MNGKGLQKEVDTTRRVPYNRLTIYRNRQVRKLFNSISDTYSMLLLVLRTTVIKINRKLFLTSVCNSCENVWAERIPTQLETKQAWAGLNMLPNCFYWLGILLVKLIGVNKNRRVTLKCCLVTASKVLEKIACDQFTEFLEKNKLLPENQHGFSNTLGDTTKPNAAIAYFLIKIDNTKSFRI